MIVLPTPFPPLLSQCIGPSPEQGQKEKPKKTNVNKHVHFAASQPAWGEDPSQNRDGELGWVFIMSTRESWSEHGLPGT